MYHRRDNGNAEPVEEPVSSTFVFPDAVVSPRGRMRRLESISTLVKAQLDRVDERAGELNSEVIAKALVNLAKSGNLTAIQMIMDQME